MNDLWCNFLNFFFAHSKTIEFRIHETTANFDKLLIYMLTCVAILKYAENFKSVFTETVTLKDIIDDYFPETAAKQIMDYWQTRRSTFCNSNDKTFKSRWKDIENAYYNADSKFSHDVEW